MKDLFKFLRDLSANNSKEWMVQHEAEYRAAILQRDSIAQEFINAVTSIEPLAGKLSIKDVVYRLNRDVRFSNDKSPYKTHMGIFVCPPYGKKSLLSGYYLHLEPANSFLCGGNYGLPTPLLSAIRRDIKDNIEEYLSIVEDPEFKHYFKEVGMDKLKTAPKGFDKDWKYIEYVKPRDFGVIMSLPDAFFFKGDPIKQLIPPLIQIKRLNDFVNFAITESGYPLMRTR